LGMILVGTLSFFAIQANSGLSELTAEIAGLQS